MQCDVRGCCHGNMPGGYMSEGHQQVKVMMNEEGKQNKTSINVSMIIICKIKTKLKQRGRYYIKYIVDDGMLL